MRYMPNISDNSNNIEQSINDESRDSYPFPNQPVSDMALFHTWSMELDTQYETEQFKKEHADLIRAIKKAPPMSNIDLVDQFKINLLWDDILLCLMEGNKNAAEQKSLALYRLYADSRGLDGFGSKVMVTQHNIIEERKQRQEEKHGIGQWLKKPKTQSEVPSVGPIQG